MVEPAGTIDEKRGQFWVDSPWKFMQTPNNLSSYEPNQVFLNLGNGRFMDIGHLSTANSDGDGRG